SFWAMPKSTAGSHPMSLAISSLFWVVALPAGQYWQLQFYQRTDSGSSSLVASTTMAWAQWRHFHITRDGGKIYLQVSTDVNAGALDTATVDWEAKTSNTYPSSFTATAGVWFQLSETSSTYTFDGWLDDVTVHNWGNRNGANNGAL